MSDEMSPTRPQRTPPPPPDDIKNIEHQDSLTKPFSNPEARNCASSTGYPNTKSTNSQYNDGIGVISGIISKKPRSVSEDVCSSGFSNSKGGSSSYTGTNNTSSNQNSGTGTHATSSGVVEGTLLPLSAGITKPHKFSSKFDEIIIFYLFSDGFVVNLQR